MRPPTRRSGPRSPPRWRRTRPSSSRRLDGPPQTNEAQRSAALAPGFLTVAALTGLPLATSELGASAGLNMAWDRFAYRFGPAAWGDPASAVRLAPAWQGRRRRWRRQGWPSAPAATGTGGRRRERGPPAAPLLRLGGSGGAAGPHRRGDRARAGGGDPGRARRRGGLARPPSRRATPGPGACGLSLGPLDAISARRRGKGSGPASPPPARGPRRSAAGLAADGGGRRGAGPALSLTLWPGGETRVLARADFHCNWVRWAGW